jgi:S-adenosylmethionine:tRNA-ribosyltransferase-isomerase (queuine synthetase)
MRELKRVVSLEGETDIFLSLGKQFRVVNHLLTNFHAQDSTVIQFTAAFIGDNLP